MNTNKPSIIFKEDKNIECYDEWLYSTEKRLIESGYTRYNQNYKSSDFQYFKNFYVGGKKVYQIGVIFYDFRKFSQQANVPEHISVSFDCLLCDIDGRIDLSISYNDIMLEIFESMSTDFYKCMNRNLIKLKTAKNRKKNLILHLNPIVKDVMDKFNISENRERLNVYNKKYLFYFLRMRLNKYVPLEDIGVMCGYGHSNVIHNIKDAEHFIATNDFLFTKSTEPLRLYLEEKFENYLKK